MQFRAEMFNALDHANFDCYVNFLGLDNASRGCGPPGTEGPSGQKLFVGLSTSPVQKHVRCLNAESGEFEHQARREFQPLSGSVGRTGMRVLDDASRGCGPPGTEDRGGKMPDGARTSPAQRKHGAPA